MQHGERFNGYTHLAGLVAAGVGGAVLLAGTVTQGSALKTAAALVFALSVLALYAASTLFHGSRGERIKRFWQQADHCAIYLLIAGTCTPFILLELQGAWRWGLLGLLWGAAAAGVRRELRPELAGQPSLALYIAMGWLCVLAAVPLAARLQPAAVAWLLAGAALYSVGTVFYRNRRGLRHAHGLWHLFVLGGTASHYMAVAGFLL
ncbi:MAG: hemolysin III family protein [Comamonadaceae bacterium]|nr:MAG: hemolysin III family protein [Comamonadaceae bacterium]